MNLYRFECTVWVQGTSAADAEQHLHDEVEYHFGQDNNLIALASQPPQLVDQVLSCAHD
jgi:hypothetical protein